MTIFPPFISPSPHMHATLNTVPPDILDYPTSTGMYYMQARLVRQIHYTGRLFFQTWSFERAAMWRWNVRLEARLRQPSLGDGRMLSRSLCQVRRKVSFWMHARSLMEFDEDDRKSLFISYISTMLVMSFNGSVLSISRVSRLHMGAYLCIAQVINSHISRSLKGFDFTRTLYFFTEWNSTKCFQASHVDSALWV